MRVPDTADTQRPSKICAYQDFFLTTSPGNMNERRRKSKRTTAPEQSNFIDSCLESSESTVATLAFDFVAFSNSTLLVPALSFRRDWEPRPLRFELLLLFSETPAFKAFSTLLSLPLLVSTTEAFASEANDDAQSAAAILQVSSLL